MQLGTALRLFARAARYRYKLNRPELARILREVPSGGWMIDVGAHKGAYSFWLSRRAGASGRVLAIEPQERLAEQLRRALASWKFTCATVLHAAASSRSGPSTIHVPRDSTHGASLNGLDSGRAVDAVAVNLVTIDEVVAEHSWPRLDFLKVDAEGHEIEVITGALRAIERFKPRMLIESEARAHASDDSHLATLCKLLGPLGYRGSFHDGRRWRPIEEMDVELHQNYGKGRYCNNVYFEPAGAG